jgi:hypothetical protein
MPPPEAPHGNAATAWFGDRFADLHPLLQALHRDGGVLRGDVDIATGAGIAGVAGRRLARRLGIPVDRARRGFEVRIVHDAAAMRWIRRFDDGSVLASTFQPHGRHPDGFWTERSGALRLRLGVDLDGGGWRWRLLGLRAFGLPLPRALLRVDAFKRIERARYRFGVRFALPLLGDVLRYEGLLRSVPGTDAAPDR